MQLDIYPFDLQLASPFRISHESRTVQPTLIVQLTDGNGISGLGEAPMTRYYGLVSAECMRTLVDFRPYLLPLKTLAPAEVHQLIDQYAPDLHPFLRCALEVAAHDLWAKKQGKRLNLCWSQAIPDHRIPTSYTIGMGAVNEMVEKIKAFPWPVYKIKLGTPQDLDIIRALREVTTATFRVDANTAWTVEQSLAYAPILRDLGVEFIEQPLASDNWVGQKVLFERSALPIVADESCQTEADVARCHGHFHGINIKVVKCGGLLPARRMIRKAKSLGMRVMAGCMTESSVGISAIAQLIPELDYVDVDGAMLLKDEPATGVTFSADGIVRYVNAPGTGARLRI
ncbi:MAG: dipeptide epimerase [Bacteroidota bacterium]